ncbi:MAG: PAS domain-containing protein [Burkholderiales bacterium]|jgi:hypothetical protein|nr:PAS domain-containing protein [Burkholderiales bacterium]
MSTIALNDQEFLDFYIKTLELNPPARSVSISNLQHHILFANATFLEFIGLTTEEVIGKRMRELDSFIAEYAGQSLPMAEKALAQDKHVRWILQITKNNKQFWIDCYMLRLKNPFNGNLVGMTSNLNWARISSPMLNLINALNKKLLIVENSNKNILNGSLSTQEREIVALLAIGKSYKEVAWILGSIHNQEFNPATIATNVYRKIFPKFEVSNLSELITKAVQFGILDSIPESFI